MTEQEEMNIFQLISAAGTAKSCYMEALQKAKEKNYDEAEALIKEGDQSQVEGHRIHAEMLSASAAAVESSENLILVHAEDQMMSAETIKIMVLELIEVYKKLDA